MYVFASFYKHVLSDCLEDPLGALADDIDYVWKKKSRILKRHKAGKKNTIF